VDESFTAFSEVLRACRRRGGSNREIGKQVQAADTAVGHWFHGRRLPRDLDQLSRLLTVIGATDEEREHVEILWSEQRLKSEAPDAFRVFSRLRRVFDPCPEYDGESEDDARLKRMTRWAYNGGELSAGTHESVRLIADTLAIARKHIGELEDRAKHFDALRGREGLPDVDPWFRPADAWRRYHDGLMRLDT
jgi:hypothetical protein